MRMVLRLSYIQNSVAVYKDKISYAVSLFTFRVKIRFYIFYMSPILEVETVGRILYYIGILCSTSPLTPEHNSLLDISMISSKGIFLPSITHLRYISTPAL